MIPPTLAKADPEQVIALIAGAVELAQVRLQAERELATSDDPTAGCPGVLTMAEAGAVLKVQGRTVVSWCRECGVELIGDERDFRMTRASLRELIRRKSKVPVGRAS